MFPLPSNNTTWVLDRKLGGGAKDLRSKYSNLWKANLKIFPTKEDFKICMCLVKCHPRSSELLLSSLLHHILLNVCPFFSACVLSSLLLPCCFPFFSCFFLLFFLPSFCSTLLSSFFSSFFSGYIYGVLLQGQDSTELFTYMSLFPRYFSTWTSVRFNCISYTTLKLAKCSTIFVIRETKCFQQGLERWPSG